MWGTSSFIARHRSRPTKRINNKIKVIFKFEWELMSVLQSYPMQEIMNKSMFCSTNLIILNYRVDKEIDFLQT